jgi:hypothetical protein
MHFPLYAQFVYTFEYILINRADQHFLWYQRVCLIMCLQSLSQDWALELEDVFAVDREGEAESFTPFKMCLENHMLLWHGQLLWHGHVLLFLPCSFDKQILQILYLRTFKAWWMTVGIDLCWELAGSRTTNYVGILSQGLRIAPPEAPVTGYMVYVFFLCSLHKDVVLCL